MANLARHLTIALLLLLAGAFALREHIAVTSAAGGESLTWGAAYPTWSPDGERLAFSLFGSIWEVSAGGGQARQITTSAGYHAHPAWSPAGDKIAFIRGAAPRGPTLNISGALRVVDVASGRETPIKTPYPTAGTVSWAPDASRLVVGLSAPGSPSQLHQIDAGTGEVTALQRRARTGRWIAASWNPKRDEIFYATLLRGEPQVFSMPSSAQGSIIQMPLTRYRPEHVAIVGDVSALPDGSGVIYSAVEVNGKGDYDLFRISRQGGPWMALTSTSRDELSPAVSPDGTRIAHVSNHLGNLDLFTMPVAGGEKKHVRLTELKFRGPSGKIRVKILDELGNPTPARLYVRASDGKAYCPPGEQIFYYRLTPGGDREGFFIASGDDAFPAPAGDLKFTALKGVEYKIAERRIEVLPNRITEVVITLERWTNWAQRGWYTGENHFHANYNGSYYQRPKQSLAWLRAEDLNTANMIVANSSGAFIHDKEFFTGAVHSLSTARYKLYWGEEYRNSDPLGHMGFLNLKKLVPPFFTSVVGSNSPYDFPLNTMAAIEARRQGGLVTYMHPVSRGVRDVFDTSLGAKESPVTAALGALDAFDVLPFGESAYDMWYTLLNAGFKISPGAGTDCFTNWRGINRIPGGARQYVQVGSAMDWNRWIERYRQGRAFVTNGPLIDFSVNGQPMGAEIPVSSGSPYRARLAAEITSRVPLARIAFIENGVPIETRIVNSASRTLRLEKDVEVRRSSWFAVRVSGIPTRGIPDDHVPRAHSGPIYIRVDGQPALRRRDLETLLRWVERLWAYLEERDNFGPGDNRRRARQMIDKAREHYLRKLARLG